MKTVDWCLKQFEPIKTHLVTLQECRPLDQGKAKIHWENTDSNQWVGRVRTQASLQTDTGHQVIWRGIKAMGWGVAVVSTKSWPLEFVDIPFLHRHVVPVKVHAPEPFMFVGVWTQREPSYARVAWESMSACAHEADKRGLPLVAAGDFNISRKFKGKLGEDASNVLKSMRDRYGLVSAYHQHYNEKQGEETRFTYYHKYMGRFRPFHIDYFFVSEDWIDRLIGVKVEPFSTFQDSDHRPLTVELDDAIFGIIPQRN
ncbi:MAG: hypothetical protein OXN89_18640 [Bryobacterales bacterium]|nr:hypothetical protein [Bryobacterales bacterium]